MKFDLKTLLTVGGILVTLAGFYYTTQMRLDSLEKSVVELQEADSDITKMVNRKFKKLSK